jgi:hypothetical protein
VAGVVARETLLKGFYFRLLKDGKIHTHVFNNNHKLESSVSLGDGVHNVRNMAREEL